MTQTPAIIDHTARAHSSVGDSSAKRIMECPGSMLLCEKYPSKSSEYAEEGTAGHEAIDMILQGKTRKDTDVIGLTFNGIVITEEFFDEAIAPSLQIFDALDKELGDLLRVVLRPPPTSREDSSYNEYRYDNKATIHVLPLLTGPSGSRHRPACQA